MDNLDHIHILLGKYFSKEISEEELIILQQWLDEDISNRQYFSEMESIWDSALSAFPVENIEEENAWNRIYSHLHRFRVALYRGLFYWQRIAAILILPLLGIFLFMLLQKDENGEVEAYLTIACPYGTHMGVELPDGSKVSLNSGSSLRYPSRFQVEERNVFLVGEGYFEVASDVKHPFIVSTELARVKATGTAFNVEAYPGEEENTVTLVKGKVDVLWKGNEETVILHPNERSIYNLTIGRSEQVVVNDVYRWYAWKDGTLIFRNDPLREVVERLNKIYNADITVRDADLAEYPYRATFVNKSLKEILDLLKISAPIEIRSGIRKDDPDMVFEKQKIDIFKK